MKKGHKYSSLVEKVHDFIVNRVESSGGCWFPPSQYSYRRDRYFHIGFGTKKTHRLHKLVLEIMVLKRPLREGFETCHRCGVKACFNPSHLYEGTHADNGADYGASGTYNAKLIDDDIRFIREMYASGRYTQYELASMFGVSQGKINHIITRKAYSWVEQEETPIIVKRNRPGQRLTEEDVRYIRATYSPYKPGCTHRDLSERYDVSEGTIRQVISRRTFDWVN